MKIGDRVTLRTQPSWSGIVVRVHADQVSELFRVYWQAPEGKIAEYRPGEILQRRWWWWLTGSGVCDCGL